MARTKDETIREVTQAYLSSINLKNPPNPADIQGDILDALKIEFNVVNSALPKGEKWRCPDTLSNPQIADIMLTIYRVVCINFTETSGERDYDLLSIYMDHGPDEGIYVSDESAFRNIARKYRYSAGMKDTAEIMAILRDKAPRKTRCSDQNLIAVNNGIFDYDTKTLMPFDPEKVFISKSRVSYNPKAKSPTIHNRLDNTDWEVEAWMKELSDDPEIVQSLWEILGAIIRPNVSWDKSAWFYSNQGNNGKGTLCELMRQLCGEGSYASIPLSSFSKDFMLEPLLRASAIIVDENDVGSFIDKAANIKAIITNDRIEMNRKYKTPVSYKFRGFMVQCLNEYPRIKDKSESVYRRQLFIPFEKCFTGKERKYIKTDYIHRKDVLEYVLKRVLEMNYYTLSTPKRCKDTLEDYKAFNDPVREFLDDILPESTWNLLPFGFLYDLYKSWFKKNSPNGSIQGRNTFINDVCSIIGGIDGWYTQGPKAYIKTADRMDEAELLIYEYGLTEWMNPNYRASKDIKKMCMPAVKPGYRGLLRTGKAIAASSADAQAGDDSDDSDGG